MMLPDYLWQFIDDSNQRIKTSGMNPYNSLQLIILFIRFEGVRPLLIETGYEIASILY